MKNNLKKYRKMLKLSQEDLAAQLFITRQTIINIEKNKHQPSLELAFRLAKMFNCSIHDLFSLNTSP
tara:strand:+ start:129 stop:329 length:201 start_codon:yes stop_codon:yes gene_type:complete